MRLHETMADPAFYRRDGAEIAEARSRLEALDRDLAGAYARWEELDTGRERVRRGRAYQESTAMRLPQITIFRLAVLLVVGSVVFVSVFYAAFVTLVIFPEFNSTDTVYSKGYSESNFQSLRVGMTPDQVEGLMGRPLKKITMESFHVWWYSESPGSNDFQRRHVVFREGRVCDIINDFYVD